MLPTKFFMRPPLIVTMFAASWFLGGATHVGAQSKETRRLSATEFENLHQRIKPQAGEARWMEITWYPNVWEARQKAAAEGKPLFLWAGSGGAPAAGC
jgi:hypothetical protein